MLHKVSISIAIAILGAGVCSAAPLPDSPAPRTTHEVAPEQVRRLNRGDVNSFWNSRTRTEAAIMLGAAAFDMGQTCHNLAHGGTERMLPTQSCAGAVAITAGFELAAAGGAWLLHRTHHDKLALVPMVFMSEQSLRGIIYSKQHHAF